MIVEMTAVRAVQPFFGSTTYVWTNVIAVVLAALAVGLRAGRTPGGPAPVPARSSTASSVPAACSSPSPRSLVTPVSRPLPPGRRRPRGRRLGPALGLARHGPRALRARRSCSSAPSRRSRSASWPRRGVGRAVGIRLRALDRWVRSSAPTCPRSCSCPHLGSRGSILVAAGILLVAAAVGLLTVSAARRGRPSPRSCSSRAPLALGAAGAGLVPPGRPAPRLDGGVATVLEETESPYQYLTVRDDVWPEGTERVLTINEGLYTCHALPGARDACSPDRGIYDAYTVLPFLLDLEVGSRLDLCVVGMACGVNAAQWHHFFSAPFDLRVDGAELDPEVVRLGRRYFDLPGRRALASRSTPSTAARCWSVCPTEKRYDTIVLDAFANELYVPFHLATREFFALCERRLERGGLLAMNVYARGDEAPNLVAIENTMAAVFRHVLRVPHYDAGGYLLLARRGEAPVDPHASRPTRSARASQAWDGFAGWIGDAGVERPRSRSRTRSARLARGTGTRRARDPDGTRAHRRPRPARVADRPVPVALREPNSSRRATPGASPWPRCARCRRGDSCSCRPGLGRGVAGRRTSCGPPGRVTDRRPPTARDRRAARSAVRRRCRAGRRPAA